MMSLKVVSSKQAGNYYSKDDYYSKDQGQWQGKGAEALGLKGEVSKEDFQKIMHGQDQQGNQLVHSNNGKTLRGGVDLTFSAGKGYSTVALVGGDKRLLDLHERAVTKALDFAEKYFSQVRATEEGITKRVDTGNYVIAKFTHETSRLMDPQLHVHAVVANCSQTQTGEWKAISNEKLFAYRVLISQVYRNELAAGLKEYGYGIQTGKNGLLDIKGVPNEITQAYSQRREEILRALNGREGAALAEKVTLMTREAKPYQVDREVIKQEWIERAHELGYSPERIQELTLHVGRETGRDVSPREHLQQAIDALQTQNVVWSREAMLKVTLQDGLIDGLRIDRVEQEIRNAQERGSLVQLADNRYTSLEAIRTEQKIIEIVQSRQGVFMASDPNRINQVIKEFGYLNQGQEEAIRLITGTRDGVVGVQGYAGVGKTSMLSIANHFWEKEGVLVQGLAYTGKAAEGLQTEAGIQSQTLHSFLAEKERSPGIQTDRAQVWVIDEASMIGNRQMLELLSAAARENAKVVLLGDVRQLQAIDAGKPFQQLQEKNLMATARMEEILRQKNEELKNAVEAIAKELDPNKAISILERMGAIKQIENQSERLSTIARDYLTLSPKEMKKTLIVTATNSDRLQINSNIRELMKEKGLINPGTEKTFTVAIPKSIKEEERRIGESYAQGDLVRFGRASEKLEVGRGERGIIKEIDGNKLTVQMEHSNKAVVVNLEKYNKLELYSLESRQFAPGDQVAFLKNDRTLGVVNSSIGTVKEAGNNQILKIETRSGIKEVDLSKYNYMDHSYGSTFHKSQGMTAERVMIHIDTHQKLSNSANSFYVGLSRASHEATVYTDSREKLGGAVSLWQEKESIQDHAKASHLDFGNGKETNPGNTKNIDISIDRGRGI